MPTQRYIRPITLIFIALIAAAFTGCSILRPPPPTAPLPPHAVVQKCLTGETYVASARMLNRARGSSRFEEIVDDLDAISTTAANESRLCEAAAMQKAIHDLTRRTSAALAVVRASVASAALASERLDILRESCQIARDWLSLVPNSTFDIDRERATSRAAGYRLYAAIACRAADVGVIAGIER